KPIDLKIARTIQAPLDDCKGNRDKNCAGAAKPLAKSEIIKQIAVALERLADIAEQTANDKHHAPVTLEEANAYRWDPDMPGLHPVVNVARVPLDLLKGIDDKREQLLQNSLQFARGHAANNALLWGARGMGKSSLIKALHAEIEASNETGLKRLVLVEINREDLSSLPELMQAIGALEARFIIFCDDLSFDKNETSYKSLKTILDGGLAGRPQNTLFYATSNRRHLMARDMIENERSSAINPSEAVEEKISLSDRFGLWLGFHNCTQDEFLAMVGAYIDYYKIDISTKELNRRAIEWAATRGSRSGRVAIQFVRQIAGERGQDI
ncbi:ATP-DEPENDENT PROTEASE SUBUNIT, partial [hydrothermal vent metagenome]